MRTLRMTLPLFALPYFHFLLYHALQFMEFLYNDVTVLVLVILAVISVVMIQFYRRRNR